jgi:hypothetical protein
MTSEPNRALSPKEGGTPPTDAGGEEGLTYEAIVAALRTPVNGRTNQLKPGHDFLGLL